MLLIDTDPGLDDIHALGMAAARLPPSEIAVTTVAGNVGLDSVTRNARWFLGVVSPEVPIWAGAAGPLVGRTIDAAHIHSGDGLGGAPRLPAAEAPLRGGHAVEAILEHADRHGRDLTIVALGPLTNLALALQLAPDLGERIGGVVAMGGSPAGFGNASANAEYNVYADPVAAEIVFERVPRITLITWDLCLETRFSAEELASFWAGPGVAATTLRSVHEHRLAASPDYARSETFGRADPLAMAVALDRACVADSESHPVRVGFSGGLDHGATVVDRRGLLSTRPDIEIVRVLDRERVLSLLTV